MVESSEAMNCLLFDDPVTTGFRPVTFPVEEIVSGGQTGVDRAALDWAIEHGVPHGGWCPQGRRAEDGKLGPQYLLKETPETQYVQRTEWNVRDSDATLLVTLNARLTAGTKQTLQFARRYKKPCLHLARTVPMERTLTALRTFIRDHGIKKLNVAGSRESDEPGVGEFVAAIFDKLAS
jgi:hypothetical protein